MGRGEVKEGTSASGYSVLVSATMLVYDITCCHGPDTGPGIRSDWIQIITPGQRPAVAMTGRKSDSSGSLVATDLTHQPI